MVVAWRRGRGARCRLEPSADRHKPKKTVLSSTVCAVRLDDRDSKEPSIARARMATADGATRRRGRTGLDLRRADRLDGRRPAGGPRQEPLSGWQDQTYVRLVGRGTRRCLSLLPVHGLSE